MFENKTKGWFLKNLPKCSAWKMFTKSVENGNKNADIFFLCPRGKKWVVNHFSNFNSFRDMNFQKWLITDESWGKNFAISTFVTIFCEYILLWILLWYWKKYRRPRNKYNTVWSIGLYFINNHGLFTFILKVKSLCTLEQSSIQ